jgi:hypothetical protein
MRLSYPGSYTLNDMQTSKLQRRLSGVEGLVVDLIDQTTSALRQL